MTLSAASTALEADYRKAGRMAREGRLPTSEYRAKHTGGEIVMALTPAQKQRRYRERVKERLRAEGRQVVVHYRKPKEERSMRKRWRRHVAALVEIQEQVRDRRDRVPPSLEDSPYARAADAFLSIDLSELEANDPPLGYGRD